MVVFNLCVLGNRGGNGKTDTGGEKKPTGGAGNSGGGGNPSNIKFNTNNKKVYSEPWMYIVVGALCGMFMVLILVFSILSYRRRRMVMSRRHGFDNNLELHDWRLLSVRSNESQMSCNNNIYVSNGTMTRSHLVSSLSCYFFFSWSIP